MAMNDDLREYAASIGCDVVGVTTAGSIPEVGRQADERVGRGYLRDLDWFTPERALASAEPARLLSGARSIVVVAVSYLTDDEPSSPGAGPRGIVARCARGADYHRVLRNRLRLIADWLRSTCGDSVVARPCVDKDWLAERAIARRAGLGTLGRNATLITPTHGSWVFLGEVVTTALLDPSPPPTTADLFADCGDCHRCVDTCPTGALVGPGEIDARRCLSLLTIESAGWLPRELRPALGASVYGCDRCQEVCPRNVGARVGNHAEFAPASGVGATLPLAELLDVTDSRILVSRFAGTTLARAALHGLRRNAAVVLGNLGDRGAAAPLARALGDPDPLVRGHAAWALGRLGGGLARWALERACHAEPDPAVRREIVLALGETPSRGE